MDDLLMIPGPTLVPDAVRQAVSRQMINHRGPLFTTLYNEIQPRLRQIFGAREDILIFPSAGTGVMESAIVNLFSPGECVLACVMGEFGERFAKIAEVFGLHVDRLVAAPGKACTAEMIAQHLDAKPAGTYKGVLVTHNETSTAVTLDLQAVAREVKSRGLLLAVDGVSSVGGIEVRCDEWEIDVLVTSSQKALMTPPGLGLAYVNPQAWSAVEGAKLPRFYWDYRKARASAAKGQTPYTPAVGLWFGLSAALKMIENEGLAAVYRRHQLMGRACRAGIRALGLRLLADESCASPVVTAVHVPEGLDGSAFIKELREKYRLVVAGGQGALSGKIFRIAHMGAVTGEQLIKALSVIGRALSDHGLVADPEAGAAAARDALAGSMPDTTMV